MAKPIDFLIKNQQTILELYYGNETSPQRTWYALQEVLPKLRQAMSFSTFKQYLYVLIALRDKMQNQNEKEVSKLREAMNQKDVELSAVRSRLKEMEENLSELKQKGQSIEGWTVRLTSKGYYNLCKSFGGKVESIYIGKILEEGKARRKIAERMSKLRQDGVIPSESKAILHK
jgi:predicted nuclease with TOPRIM domain